MAAIVPLGNIDAIWPEVSRFIDAALKNEVSAETLIDQYNKVRAGDAFLAVFQHENTVNGAMIFDFIQTDQGQAGHVWTWGAEKSADWVSELNQIWDFMRSNGAEFVICEGRKGFGRKYQDAFKKPVREIRRTFKMEL